MANWRKTDPETSREAALSLDEVKITNLMKSILNLLGEPMFDDQLIAKYNSWRDLVDGDFASPSGIRSRRADLVKLGLVKDTGERVTLRSGRKSIVWKAVTNV